MDDSTLYYTTTPTTDAGTLAFLGAFAGFVFLFVVLTYVLTSLGLMQFFKKANKPGWAAWVPIYNYYVMVEIAGIPMYWFWILLASILVTWIPGVGFVTLGVSIYVLYKFLERYGKDIGHVILAVLFPFVYFIVVGNSKDLKYSPAPAAPKTPPAGPQS